MSWICEVFIEKYIKEEVDDALYDRNKGLLVKLFQDVIDKMPKATEILGVYFWIIWIVDTDNKALLYDIKMKECWSIMIGSWTHDIEACEKLEKVLKDLLEFLDNPPSSEQKYFVKNIISSIKTCLGWEISFEVPSF